jgi:16S rRNA (uracil1498-N3)-methyltransferase
LFAQPFPEEGAVLVFVGPEGGFSRQEAKELARAGVRTVHLGPRILRAETAAAVTLALVQAAWGDLGAGGLR